MKRLLVFGLSMAALLVMASSAFAQPRNDKKGGSDANRSEWYSRMKQERIAYFTTECGFTDAEAKAFWPVYEQIENERREATRESMTAYRELSDAVKAGKNDAEIEKLLQKCVEAGNKNVGAEDAIARYKTVLPAAKVAKVILAEERFRQQQIQRLHGGQGGPQGAPQGGRPGGNFQGGGRPQQGGGRPGGWGGGNQEQDF